MKELRMKDGKFKIMQIADIQENAEINPDTIKLITLALQKEKPDLVVLTGDQIQGYDRSYRSDAEKKVKGTIDSIIAPLKKEGIPFCLTFGNHDEDAGVTKLEQRLMYEEAGDCIFGEMHDEKEDIGTHFVKIKDSCGNKELYVLYFVDTQSKDSATGAYAPVKKEQVSWLRRTMEKNRDEKGNYLKGLVFQHIPCPEFYEILQKASPFKKGAVEAYRDRKNTFWTLDEETVKKGGFMGESPAVPEINNGEFEEICKRGNILGLFVGHDHINSFVKKYKGVDLGYTQGAGFNTYGPGAKRGVRIFVLDEENTEKYETYTVTMGELCDYKPAMPLKEFIYCHAPTSIEGVLTNLKRAGVLAVTGFAVGMLIKTIKNKI